MRELMTCEFMAVSITVCKPKNSQKRTLISPMDGSASWTGKRDGSGKVWPWRLAPLSELLRCPTSCFGPKWLYRRRDLPNPGRPLQDEVANLHSDSPRAGKLADDCHQPEAGVLQIPEFCPQQTLRSRSCLRVNKHALRLNQVQRKTGATA